ncbi:hypothetical protein GVAV_001492 [Gurleya vavrai]
MNKFKIPDYAIVCYCLCYSKKEKNTFNNKRAFLNLFNDKFLSNIIYKLNKKFIIVNDYNKSKWDSYLKNKQQIERNLYGNVLQLRENYMVGIMLLEEFFGNLL